MIQTDLVAHILYDTFEYRCLFSPIGRSFWDLQVEKTWQLGWEWVWCLWGRLAENRGLWQEKSGNDYPVVPVGAHGGRGGFGGRQGGPSKSCDGILTWVRSGEVRDPLFAEAPPRTHPSNPSPERSQIGYS